MTRGRRSSRGGRFSASSFAGTTTDSTGFIIPPSLSFAGREDNPGCPQLHVEQPRHGDDQQRFAPMEQRRDVVGDRSEEHTSELQSLMRISYAVFCLINTNKVINDIDKSNQTHN